MSENKRKEKELANSLKAAARESNKITTEIGLARGIKLVHIYSAFNPMGGLTVAFRKANEHKNTKMVTVAVATCSMSDAFSKKIGAANAMNQFMAGMTIDLPLLQGHVEEDLPFVVKTAFKAVYDASIYA